MQLTDLAPSNVGVMRSYANFLLDIANLSERYAAQVAVSGASG